MIEIDEKNYYIMLFDYYGDLFTPKQQSIFIQHYEYDYSLTEIATEQNISRNAVFDTIKKVQKNLEQYENILKLYANDLKLKQKLEEIKNHCDDTGKEMIDNLFKEEN